MEGIVIREMLYKDLPGVDRIEKTCFTTPWDIRSFEYELGCKDTILKVAVLNNQIIGYVCVRTILDITHILNLVVLPDFRRKGIGSMLLRDALNELKRLKPDINLITLEVRESNTAAIKLYEKFGFKVMGKRISYYDKPYENAIIMGLSTAHGNVKSFMKNEG
ncbi:MAG: ribosomal protein S18-alanine N-acetyltransferase [Thermodesulfovibrionia bacterium]|nr:ribosomal protein S18-alanine N-acetyltransferase [Thermodesulfovibrionia bacterium]